MCAVCKYIDVMRGGEKERERALNPPNVLVTPKTVSPQRQCQAHLFHQELARPKAKTHRPIGFDYSSDFYDPNTSQLNHPKIPLLY